MRNQLAFVLLAATGLLPAGCSRPVDSEARGAGYTGILAPRAPAFLSGPMAVLLTNSNGYSASVDAQADAINERDRSVSGQLTCRGPQLFFNPDSNGASQKRGRGGGFSFIWNVDGNSGYVLSESLQAYAPITASGRATNVVTQPVEAVPEKIAGHLCFAQSATVRMNNGSSASFQVMRATDLNGIALQLSAATNEVPLTVTLSKPVLKQPPAEIFAVPDGFTKYPTPEAMADELVARQHNLRRKYPTELQPLPPGPPGMAPRY